MMWRTCDGHTDGGPVVVRSSLLHKMPTTPSDPADPHSVRRWYRPQCRSPLRLPPPNPSSLSCTVRYNPCDPVWQRKQDSMCVCEREALRQMKREWSSQREKPETRAKAKKKERGHQQTRGGGGEEEERGLELRCNQLRDVMTRWPDTSSTSTSCPGALTGQSTNPHTQVQGSDSLQPASITTAMSSVGKTNHNKRLTCK